MKKLNIFLMIVLILMIALVIYFFVGAKLQTQVTTLSAPAADYPDAFATIQNIINTQSAPQQFVGSLNDEASNYTLIDTTIALINRGLFDAEWLDIAVAPAEGDLAVYSLTGQGMDIDARSVAQMNFKIITTAPTGAHRTVTLTYYVYGMLRTITVTI